MPRTYKRKDSARKYGYSTDNMQNAVRAVKENGMSIKKAAFLHGLNRSTLINHLKQYRCGPVGRPTILTQQEESLIVHALVKLGDWGFGVDRNVLQNIVTDYLRNAGKQDMFREGKPGIDWLYGFERRWKNEVTRRVAQPMPANRAYACNSVVVDDFFIKLSEVIQRLNLSDKPQNIYNVDETGFQTDIGSQRIFCRRGLRNPHKTVASSTKTMYTVQVCCSAIGEFLPMYIVFKGKHLYENWCNGGPDNARYNCSPSGWMETEQFYEWFQKVFVSGTSQLDGAKLLIFDGHSSHISPQVVQLAVENNIELLCLPAHTSSILQPLDVGVFKTVKAAWRKCLREYYDQTRYSNVDKRVFPSLLKRLVDQGSFSRGNAVSAFEACGIVPLNRSKITADKLSTSVPLRAQDNSTEANQCASSSISLDVEPLPMPTDPNVHVDSSSRQLTPSISSATETVCGKLTNILKDTMSDCRNPQQPSPLTSSVNLTPRKGIEAAILKQLRQITPPNVGEKRKRVKRTLAECLTSEEVQKRMKDDSKKQKRSKKDESRHSISKTTMKKNATTDKEVKSSRKSTKTLKKTGISSSSKSEKPVLLIRKPAWLQSKSTSEISTEISQQSTGSSISSANVLVEKSNLPLPVNANEG